MQSEMKAMKTLEENTKDNSELLKNEIPAVKENFVTLNSNIENVEQEVTKSKEEVKNTYDKMLKKVEPMRDEMKKSLKSVDDQVKLLNQKADENNSKMTSVELKSNNILESVIGIERLVKRLDYGKYSILKKLY